MSPDPRQVYLDIVNRQRECARVVNENDHYPVLTWRERAEAASLGHQMEVAYHFSKAADRGEKDTFLDWSLNRLLNSNTQLAA